MADQIDFLGVEVKVVQCTEYGESEAIDCRSEDERLQFFNGLNFYMILSGLEVDLSEEIDNSIKSQYSVEKVEFEASFNVIRNLYF